MGLQQLSLIPDLSEPVATRRAKATNDPMRVRARQSTAEGRRLADIYRGILQAIGGIPTGPQQAAALEAAELTLAAENQRSALLKGEDITIKLMQTSKQRDRALRKLGLDRPPEGTTGEPLSMRERLLRDRERGGA